MTLTILNVSLDYSEYLMLLDALKTKRKSLNSDLAEMKEILESPYTSELKEDAINVIDDCEKDLLLVSALEEKIKINSKPGGMEI